MIVCQKWGADMSYLVSICPCRPIVLDNQINQKRFVRPKPEKHFGRPNQQHLVRQCNDDLVAQCKHVMGRTKSII